MRPAIGRINIKSFSSNPASVNERGITKFDQMVALVGGKDVFYFFNLET